MSELAVVKALEVALNAIAPSLPTAWANANFVVPTGAGGSPLPYQQAWFMPARPENPSMGDEHYRQRGYLQISLRYPLNEGAGPARERARVLRAYFRRGLSLTADGVTTTVEETPEIGSGSNEGDRFVINVFVRFYADIFGA